MIKKLARYILRNELTSLNDSIIEMHSREAKLYRRMIKERQTAEDKLKHFKNDAFRTISSIIYYGTESLHVKIEAIKGVIR